MKKLLVVTLILMLVLSMVIGCEEKTEKTTMVLATTTSTENSGLLAAILPTFEKESGFKVDVVAVGTGAALKKGEDGEADVLLVHAKSSEEAFVAEGHGAERFDVMYNDFVIVGPLDDPANLKAFGDDVVKAYQAIADNQVAFLSRGDDSGTHKKEMSLWTAAELAPSMNDEWYVETGKGMGDTLSMADELQGYAMTDRATFLSMKDVLDLEIVVEGDSRLFNQYGVIAVDPDKNDMINAKAAEAFIEWLLKEETQALIAEFGKDIYGEPLFIPNAK